MMEGSMWDQSRGPHVRDQMTEELIGLSVSVCSDMTAGIYSSS